MAKTIKAGGAPPTNSGVHRVSVGGAHPAGILALVAVLNLLAANVVHASDPGLDGSVLLRTCQAAAQVKALSAICQTYINGFLDTAVYYESGSGKPGPAFCLGELDKERIPTVMVVWLNAHPEYLKQPAPAALHMALSVNFPCKKGSKSK